MIDEYDFGEGVIFAHQFLLNNNIDNFWIAPILVCLLISLGGGLLFWFVKKKLSRYMTIFVNASASKWDDLVMNKKLIGVLPWLTLASYLFFIAKEIISEDSEIYTLVYFLTLSFVVVCFALMGNSVSHAMMHPEHNIENQDELAEFRRKYLKGKAHTRYRVVAKCAGLVSLCSLVMFIVYAVLSVLLSFDIIPQNSNLLQTLRITLEHVLYFALSFSILFATFFFFKFFVFGHVSHYVRYSKTKWDDIVFNHEAIKWISLLVAEVVLYKMMKFYLADAFYAEYSILNFVFNLIQTGTMIVAVYYATAVARNIDESYNVGGIIYKHIKSLEREKNENEEKLRVYEEEEEEKDTENSAWRDKAISILRNKLEGIEIQLNNLEEVKTAGRAIPRLIGNILFGLAISASAAYLIFILSRMTGIGEGGEWTQPTMNFLKVAKIISIAIVVYFILRHFVVGFFMELVDRTETKWDDVILNEKTLNRMCMLLPVLTVWGGIFHEFEIEEMPRPVATALGIYIVVMLVMIVFAIGWGLQNATVNFKDEESFKKKPLNVFAQTMEIIAVLIGGIIIISILMNSAPTKVLAGLGASAALLTFIFKDSLVGLLSGVQLSLNNMVSVGDWITIPGTKANGIVETISLNTVKIKNFDKTVVTVQPSALMSGSFQNHKTMIETKTRQIQRTIQIDLDTVKRLTKEDMEEIANMFAELQNDIRRRKPEFTLPEDALNFEEKARQTNLRLFRLYVKIYLSNHEMIDEPEDFSTGSRIMVRQMQPTEMGLPIEIHAFVKDSAWIRYEEIQSDIFDDLFAILPEFGLKVFQIRVKA